MKMCINCKSDMRDEDRYCRNCGMLNQKIWYYIFINIIITFLTLVILFIIIMFIASYYV